MGRRRYRLQWSYVHCFVRGSDRFWLRDLTDQILLYLEPHSAIYFRSSQDFIYPLLPLSQLDIYPDSICFQCDSYPVGKRAFYRLYFEDFASIKELPCAESKESLLRFSVHSKVQWRANDTHIVLIDIIEKTQLVQLLHEVYRILISTDRGWIVHTVAKQNQKRHLRNLTDIILKDQFAIVCPDLPTLRMVKGVISSDKIYQVGLVLSHIRVISSGCRKVVPSFYLDSIQA